MQRISAPDSDWKECSGHPRWGSSTFRYRRAPYLPEASELPIIDSEVSDLRIEKLGLRLALFRVIETLLCDEDIPGALGIAREAVHG